MEHLADGAVQDLLEGRGSEDVLQHIDGCGACRALVAESLRAGSLGSVGADPARPTLARLPSGIELGRYRIERFLGAGNMGQVYAAYDPELDRWVALKVLPLGLDEGAAARLEARLRMEGRALARLRHPNVTLLYDVGRSAGRFFLAMELVDGRTLRDWLAEAQRSADEVHEVFRRAGEGLAAAHGEGLVHRDFKPENVLIDEAGQVRVTDFGLACAAGEVSTASEGAGGDAVSPLGESTRTGALIGTPAYMAPEQLAGLPADARSDVFSFAVALYEALHDERPFAGETVAELRAAIERDEVRPARRGARATPWVRRVLLGALRNSPPARPATMRALLVALSRARGARRRWAAGGAALAALALAVLVWPRAAPAPSPTSAKELRLPRSPQAARLYLEGLSRLRTRDEQLGLLRLQQAAELEPGNPAIEAALVEGQAALARLPLAVLRVAPAGLCASPSESLQLTTTAQDAQGRQLQAQLTWRSADESVATVSATGLVSARGVGSTTVTAFAGGQASNAVAVSISAPPAGLMAYSARDGNGSSTVRLANLDGSHARTVAQGWNPRLSPDGSALVYQRGGTYPSGPGDSLYLYDLQSGRETLLHENDDFIVGAGWASDSRSVFFDHECFVYRVLRDGSGKRLLFRSPDCYDDAPDVNPVTGRVAFQNIQAGDFINLIDAGDESGATRAKVPGTADDYTPRWSPDGSWLAVLRVDGTSKSERVDKIRPDGSGRTTLTVFSSESHDYALHTGAWTPDGRWLVTPISRGGTLGIYAVAADGSGCLRSLPVPAATWADFVGSIR